MSPTAQKDVRCISVCAKQHVQTKGFTLIELMITVGIIALLTGAIIPSFNSFITGQNSKQAQEQFKSDLRNVQNKALTGTVSDLGVKYWGVYMPSGNNATYKYFASTEMLASCDISASNPLVLQATVSTSVPLGSGAVIKGPASPGCILFSIANGDALFVGSLSSCSAAGGSFPAGATWNCVNIGSSAAATTCRQVGTNSMGLVKNGSSEVPC